MIWLRKANDDVISHCKCGDGRIAIPDQMDCPWCGCGWLFSCMTCRKAFTFAEAVEIPCRSWEELALEDMTNYGRKDIDEEWITMWVEAMQSLLEELKTGSTYCILDWTVFPKEVRNIEFDGLHSRHRLVALPQVEAIADRSVLERELMNISYWQETALPEEE